VPLGTYSSGAATVASGQHVGAALLPSFSGRGCLASALVRSPRWTRFVPRAVTGAPTSSRVRVADVEDCSPDSLTRIERVAADITGLGLDVRVVAGTSLAPAGIYLPDYFVDGSDLGWTVQAWTSLGAAVTVERASTAASVALLVIALSAVVLSGRTGGCPARKDPVPVLRSP
jgi:hypothetical protein